MRLGRSSVHKVFLKGAWNCVHISSSMAKNSRKAFAAQSLFVDFAKVVVIPQLVVDGMEGGEKLLEGRNAQVL